MENELSLAAMERILKKAGAPRVGEDAKEALRDYLEDHASRVAEHAVELCLHADRRTVKASDVKLATR